MLQLKGAENYFYYPPIIQFFKVPKNAIIEFDKILNSFLHLLLSLFELCNLFEYNKRWICILLSHFSRLFHERLSRHRKWINWLSINFHLTVIRRFIILLTSLILIRPPRSFNNNYNNDDGGEEKIINYNVWSLMSLTTNDLQKLYGKGASPNIE